MKVDVLGVYLVDFFIKKGYNLTYQYPCSVLNNTEFRLTQGFLFQEKIMEEYQGVHLSYEKQIKLFKDRGMLFKDEEKAIEKLRIQSQS